MQGPAGRILAGPWNYMCFLCTLGITLHEPSEGVLELLDVNRGDDDVLDRAVLEAGLNALNSVNDLLGCLVSDLTEDGVAAVSRVRDIRGCAAMFACDAASVLRRSGIPDMQRTPCLSTWGSRFKNKPATTYSPTPTKVQYHRREES